MAVLIIVVLYDWDSVRKLRLCWEHCFTRQCGVCCGRHGALDPLSSSPAWLPSCQKNFVCLWLSVQFCILIICPMIFFVQIDVLWRKVERVVLFRRVPEQFSISKGKNSRQRLHLRASEDSGGFWSLRRIWHKVRHVGPFEDGDGCRIVEQHLIYIALLADSKTTTEIYVSRVRVFGDKELICKFCCVSKKVRFKGGWKRAFWVFACQRSQNLEQFFTNSVPFPMNFLRGCRRPEICNKQAEFYISYFFWDLVIV